MSNEELYNEILNATENNIAGYAPIAGTNAGGYPPIVLGGGPAVKAKAKIAGDGTLNTQVRDGKFYIRIT